jgi:protoporphyrinogen/coproporphyrinogen III oxidase
VNVRVAVVGGGLAGLLTAHALKAAGVDDVLVLERDGSPGGVARTVRRGGYSLEPGAGTLMLPHPHLSPILDHIGADLVATQGPGHRYVHDGSRLIPLPSSPRVLLSPLLSRRAMLRALAEAMSPGSPPSGDETLDSFMSRRFGRSAGEALAWLAAAGVFAGDPGRLSAASAFPILTGLERQAGSVIRGALAKRRQRSGPGPQPFVPAEGMAGLASRAASRLGDRYRGGFEVSSVARHGDRWRLAGPESVAAEHVVLACGAATARDLLTADSAVGHASASLAELGTLLGAAQQAPVAVVGLGGNSERFPIPAGFGILSGRQAEMVSLGVLLESSYAPHRAPVGHSLVKVIVGGARRPDVAEWTDERILEVIGAEMGRVLGWTDRAPFLEVTRHLEGIPQYDTGHASWLSQIDRVMEPRLHLTGWSYRGVGVAHLATDAVATARAIVETR